MPNNAAEQLYNNPLMALFRAPSRKEFKKLCAATTLTTGAVHQVITLTWMPDYPLRHRLHTKNMLPEELELSPEDLERLPREKIDRRVDQIFDHPRELVAHFFWVEDGKHWWLLVFSHKELGGARSTGWKEGSHVHMLSYLTHPQASPNDFLDEILFMPKPKLPHATHIRFQQPERPFNWPTPHSEANA